MEMSTDRRKLSPNVDIQTAAEIEEFFSAAEKEEQKKFMNKYNFDVVKDVPLGGRYEWVRIKPY
ncbi:cyclin-dependent kinase inhibitor 3-like [Impatiens glandulifera]|uniref:cyclin-dependent kinase inhibitor 3-like n=1 Tax=Impatiens glandulifera TaxID=253017 RepID=UPI001FB17CC0|nr:cyclin-dependent kinase inhibitor 3-like [Impatiens glandulifera]